MAPTPEDDLKLVYCAFKLVEGNPKVTDLATAMGMNYETMYVAAPTT